MRTFGTTEDNRIDELLQYGTCCYSARWYQNGIERTLGETKATVHFVGSTIPVGRVTKDYMEIITEYLEFLESDAVCFELWHGDKSLSNTFYIGDDFEKRSYDATYKAYSSLVDLGIKLDKWNNAPKSATIGIIAHHFLDQIGIGFDVEPTCRLTFDASKTDFSAITLSDLISCVAVMEKCNYKLEGVTLHKFVMDTDIAKTYNMDDVVYSENLTQRKSDKKLDYITVKYTTVTSETDEDSGEVSYDFNDKSYTCGSTQKVGFDINIPFIPTDENALKSYFDSFFLTMKGADFNNYSVSFIGDARVETSDKIKFANADVSAVMNVVELTWNWDGALKCTVTSGSDIGSSGSSGSYSLSQIVSNIQAMTNDLRNVKYNAVYANELYVKVAKMGFADIDTLKVEVANMGLMTAEEADIKYADIDFANVEKTSIGQMFTDVGLITDATIKDGHVTGYLDSVEINANSITAGDLSVERLIIRGSDKSIVYALNNITGALQSQNVDTLNGEILTKRSINADKLIAKSITANEIAAGTITSNEILAGTITADKINMNNLTSNTAFINAISTNRILIGAADDAALALIEAQSVVDRANSGEFKGDKGATGKGISKVVEQYYLSTSSTSLTDGSWKTTQDAYVPGRYYWTRQQITWTDSTVTYTTAILDSSMNSANSVIAAWCYNNDKTYINGGKIYTGSITAQQIAANTITADKININDLFSKNITAKNLNITGGRIDITSEDVDEDIITIKNGDNSSKYGAYGMNLEYKSIANACKYDTYYNPEGIIISASSTNGAWSSKSIQMQVDKYTCELSMFASSTNKTISLNGSYGNISVGGDVTTSAGASLNTINTNLKNITSTHKLSSDFLILSASKTQVIQLTITNNALIIAQIAGYSVAYAAYGTSNPSVPGSAVVSKLCGDNPYFNCWVNGSGQIGVSNTNTNTAQRLTVIYL